MEDKKINTKDLPEKWQRTTTAQPEEFIDKESVRKDEHDQAQQRPAGDAPVRRREGEQESGV